MAKQWPVEKPRLLHDAGYYAMDVGKNHFWPMHNSHGYDRMLVYDGTTYSDKVDDYGQWLAKTAPGVDEHSTGLGWNGRIGKPWPHDVKLHPTYWTAQESIDFLNGYRDDKPFFLKMSFHRPHSPYDPPEHWFDFYKDADLPKAVVGKWADAKYGGFTNAEPPELPRANIPPDLIHNSRQGYYGAVSFVDEQVGRVVDVLKKLGKFDNTLILFVADHGDMLGDHHLWRKTFPYEGSTRIPMIVRWPDGILDAKRGQVLHQLVELRDVLPTFLDAAGIALPPAIEGKSMLDLIRGKTAGWRTQLDLEHSTCYFKENVWTGLTDGHFKYVFYAFTGEQQLFDIDADPDELNDLAPSSQYADALRTWRGRMIEHLKVRGPRWVKNGDLMLRPEEILHGDHFPA
jgi:arylsulfatase A-like enzyme